MKSLPSIQENRIGFHHAVHRKERGNSETGIRFENLEIEATDMPFGIGSGAGVIFGVTGGVTEAVLRRLREGHNRVEMEKIKFSGVRGEGFCSIS